MKVSKQIDDKTFEVVMEECDKNDILGTHIEVTIAHDYVRFSGHSCLYTEGNLMIDHMNILGYETEVTIPIRAFQQVVLPLLNDSEYMKDSHFDIDSNGKMRYDEGLEVISFYKNGKNRVAFKNRFDQIFSEISWSMYELIKKGLSYVKISS